MSIVLVMIALSAITVACTVKVISLRRALQASITTHTKFMQVADQRIAQLKREIHDLKSNLVKKEASDSGAAPIEKPSKPKRKYYRKPKNQKS